MKINKKVLIIIGLLFIILFGIFIGLNKIKKDNKVYLTPDEMINLMTYIPYSIAKKSNVDAYNGNKIKVKDVLTTILSSSYLTLCSIKSYELNDITDEYTKKKFQDSGIQHGIFLKKDVKNVLHKNFNLDLDSLKNIDDKVKIITVGDYIAFSPVKTDDFMVLNKLFISLDSADATKNSVTLIERVLFFRSKDDKYYTYKNSNIAENDIIGEHYKTINGKEVTGSEMANMLKEETSGYKYKHIFKKNDSGYYWYSTELIEDNK